MYTVELMGGFPLNIEWNESAQEYRIRGRKDDGELSNVAIYVKDSGDGIVYNRGEIDAQYQGDPFKLDGDNRIENIGTP
jgi:hypothetical protein